MRFGVIIPVHNEHRLATLLGRFDFSSAPDVVVVDDGSTDDSIAVCEAHPVTVLRHDRRRGVGAAIRTGLLHLKANGYDAAVVMAGNNKDDPAEIPILTCAVESGADYVQGSRYAVPSERGAFPPVRALLTRLAPVLWSIRFGRRLTEVTNGFRAYRLSMLDHPDVRIEQEWLDRYELELYLHYKALALGFLFAEVPVSKVYPNDGRPVSKIRLIRSWDWWSFMRPLVLMTLRIRS